MRRWGLRNEFLNASEYFVGHEEHLIGVITSDGAWRGMLIKQKNKSFLH